MNGLGLFNKLSNADIIKKILNFCDFFTLAELSFCNSILKDKIIEKYSKQMTVVINTLKIYKSNIRINCNEDLRIYLKNDSNKIKTEIKSLIRSSLKDLYAKANISEHFFIYSKFPKIPIINFKSCDLGKKSLKHLSYFLKGRNCETLILSDNKLTSQTLEVIKKNLQNKKVLQTIKINKCFVDKSTMIDLSGIDFSNLIAKNCTIDNQIISHLVTDKIIFLNLAYNSISCDGVLAICRNMNKLSYLNLSYNNLTDLSMVYLSLYLKNNTGLKYLNVSNNKITTNGFITFISTINTNKVCLDKFNISNNIIKNLPKRLINLNELNLNYLKIGGHNFSNPDLSILIQFICASAAIIKVDLSKILFDNPGLHLIFNNLSEKNKKLSLLKLNNCGLFSTEFNDILLSYYKSDDNISTYKIQMISLKSNNIILKNLNDIMLNNYLTYLNLEENNLNLYEEDLNLFLDELLENEFIKVLNLNNNFLKEIGKQFLFKLSDKKCKSHIEKLYMKNNQISNLNIELTNILSNNKYIKELYLDQNLIGVELENNYFLNSTINTEVELISLKENLIRLNFYLKAASYYKKNKCANKVQLFIKSKKLVSDYDELKDKSAYKDISDFPNIVGL